MHGDASSPITWLLAMPCRQSRSEDEGLGLRHCGSDGDLSHGLSDALASPFLGCTSRGHKSLSAMHSYTDASLDVKDSVDK